MANQFKIEFYKLGRSALFWLLIIFNAAIGISAGYSWHEKRHVNDVMFPFMDALPDVSLFFVVALFTAWIIGGNFGSRTIHHEVTSGLSRFSIIISRSVVAIVAGVILHVVDIFAGVIGMAMYVGFDTWNFTSDMLPWTGTVLLQFIALICFFVFVGFLCCNMYAGLIASVVIEVGLCNIARNFLGEFAWYKYSFFHLAETTKSSELLISSVVAVISIFVLTGLSYLVFRKREV